MYTLPVDTMIPFSTPMYTVGEPPMAMCAMYSYVHCRRTTTHDNRRIKIICPFCGLLWLTP